MANTSIIIKIKSSCTIDLSPLYGLDLTKQIIWGDGNTTTNTATHTYTSSGKYEIKTEFSRVTKITDDFYNTELEEIDISSLSANIESIGKNFLKGCNNLIYLDISNFTSLNNIGENFLDGCNNIIFLKVPYYKKTFLESWGNNVFKTGSVILCGRKYASWYKGDSVWGLKSSIMKETGIVYDDEITEEYIAENTIGKNPFIDEDSYIDITNYDKIAEAIDNGNILVYNSIERTLDEDTRRYYVKDELDKKTYFILRTELYFKDNPNAQTPTVSKYFYCRYFKAIEEKIDQVSEHRLLKVKSIDEYTEFFNYGEVAFSTYKKYCTVDMEIDKSKTIFNKKVSVLKDGDTSIENPPYMKGKIIFGEVNESNTKNAIYNGDEDTGVTISIYAKGVCKNPIIYDYDVDKSLGRRPYIKINTDNMPLGKIIKGDDITITTMSGKKSATLIRAGETINIMKYIDINSTWLSLTKGDNLFYAKGDSGVEYFKTTDTSIVIGKTYYTRSGSSVSGYVYTKVINPVESELSNYYESRTIEGSILNLDIRIYYNELYEGI